MGREQKIIMYDSPEAATYKTGLEGWVTTSGQFSGQYWGKDEHMARWSGCTHTVCQCGNVHPKVSTLCDSCRAKKDAERFDAMPVVEWDEVTPVVVFNDDRYFFDLESVLDYMADLEPNSDLRLCLCGPIRLHYVSEDNWCDDLPEDGELPDAVQAKLDELNAAIKEAGPVSWTEGSQRINMAPLWAQMKEETNAPQN